ncbi:MAG: hypothetical protein KatS3mg103_0982 [Phycisphaerales bacterium]|nr:MAG: hypothetical protein KatS3mg103_0982 [Phycisphaerales bacterium]
MPSAGSIVAIIGIKDSITGDTLCDPNNPILLERMLFPEPVISMSIEPNTSEDKRKLSEALVTIRREDPSFQSHYDEETGQTIISGHGRAAPGDHPQPPGARHEDRPCRWASRASATARRSRAWPRTSAASFVKQTGGRGQFGDVTINLRPYTKEQAEADGLKFIDGVAFENKIVGGAIPKEFIPSVEVGIRQTAASGVTAGYPLINIKAELIDGSYHPVDSSQVAFEQAARLALREAVSKAGSMLLEPIMKVVITTPRGVLRQRDPATSPAGAA